MNNRMQYREHVASPADTQKFQTYLAQKREGILFTKHKHHPHNLLTSQSRCGL